MKNCLSCGMEVDGDLDICFRCRLDKFRKGLVPSSLDKIRGDIPNILWDSLIQTNGKMDIQHGEKVHQESYYLWGPPGTGKSYNAAALLAQAVVEKPFLHFAWVNIPELLFHIRMSFSDITKPGSDLLEKIKDQQYLVLDDLGVEKVTDWTKETLYIIINSRYEQQRPTVITSNLSLEDLGDRFGDNRLPSRIEEMTHKIYSFKSRKDRRAK